MVMWKRLGSKSMRVGEKMEPRRLSNSHVFQIIATRLLYFAQLLDRKKKVTVLVTASKICSILVTIFLSRTMNTFVAMKWLACFLLGRFPRERVKYIESGYSHLKL